MNSRAVLFPTMYNMFDWNAGIMFYWYIEIIGLIAEGEGEEEGKGHSKVDTLRVRQKWTLYVSETNTVHFIVHLTNLRCFVVNLGMS